MADELDVRKIIDEALIKALNEDMTKLNQEWEDSIINGNGRPDNIVGVIYAHSRSAVLHTFPTS